MPHRAHHLRKMSTIADLHAEEHRKDFVAVGPFHRHSVDVCIGLADAGGEIGEKAAPVGHQHPDAGIEHALHVGRPFDVDKLTRVDALLAQRHAIAQMNDQPLPLAELTDDRIAGNWPAAARVLNRHAFDAA